MGVKDLWNLLRSADLVTHYEGSSDHQKVVGEVQGKVIAVDISQWLFHANTQPELLSNFSTPEARCLKVAFERVRLLSELSPRLSASLTQHSTGLLVAAHPVSHSIYSARCLLA